MSEKNAANLLDRITAARELITGDIKSGDKQMVGNSQLIRSLYAQVLELEDPDSGEAIMAHESVAVMACHQAGYLLLLETPTVQDEAEIWNIRGIIYEMLQEGRCFSTTIVLLHAYNAMLDRRIGNSPQTADESARCALTCQPRESSWLTVASIWLLRAEIGPERSQRWALRKALAAFGKCGTADKLALAMQLRARRLLAESYTLNWPAHVWHATRAEKLEDRLNTLQADPQLVRRAINDRVIMTFLPEMGL